MASSLLELPQLPSEVWFEVVAYLDVREALALRGACRDLRAVVSSDVPWDARARAWGAPRAAFGRRGGALAHFRDRAWLRRDVPLRGVVSVFNSGYACVVEGLTFTPAGVRARFCVRGDGSLGPLQSAAHSTLSLRAWGRGSARDTRTHTVGAASVVEEAGGASAASSAGSLYYGVEVGARGPNRVGSVCAGECDFPLSLPPDFCAAPLDVCVILFRFGEAGYSWATALVLTPEAVAELHLGHLPWLPPALAGGAAR